MLREDPRREAYRLVGCQSAVGCDIQRQLVEVCLLTDTSVLNRDVDSLYRSVNRVNRDDSDLGILVLVLVSADISSSLGDRKLNEQLRLLAGESGDNQIGIHDVNILICLDIAGVYNAFSLILDVCGLGLVGLTGVLDRQALDVHDDIRNIFFYTRNRAELMLNTIDFDLADCRARK